MSLDELLTSVITTAVYVAVAMLLVTIVVANLYAILHAWRSERLVWFIVLLVSFLTGGGIATAVYLFLHWDEPLPRAAASRRRAPA